MSKQAAFLGALRDGDVDLLWRMWGTWFPQTPQPADRAEAEVQFHAARTACRSIALKLRSHSHYWLTERGLPSMLPVELQPKAEQFKPRIVAAVGFSWDSTSSLLRGAKPHVMSAVNEKIEEMAADGLLEKDPERVSREMMFAKNRVLHSLFGNAQTLKGKNA